MFNDGDERTLRRTQLCLKGDKHFEESEVSGEQIFPSSSCEDKKLNKGLLLQALEF